MRESIPYSQDIPWVIIFRLAPSSSNENDYLGVRWMFSYRTAICVKSLGHVYAIKTFVTGLDIFISCRDSKTRRNNLRDVYQRGYLSSLSLVCYLCRNICCSILVKPLCSFSVWSAENRKWGQATRPVNSWYPGAHAEYAERLALASCVNRPFSSCLIPSSC